MAKSPQDVYDELSDDKFIILNGYDNHYDKRRNWLIGQEYGIQLPRNQDNYAAIKNWCRENCSELVVFCVNVLNNGDDNVIYFSNEEDAMAFKLRWL